MKQLPDVKLPRKVVAFILVATFVALTFWLVPTSRFYIIIGTVIVAFATLVFGLELFKKSKRDWAAILGVGFAMFIISVAVWAASRADVINEQQKAAPAIANTPCEVLLTIVGLQWEAEQAPVEHCNSVAATEALIRSQTETFGETDWSERQIVALLGPNRDKWDTGALLIERTAYSNALQAHQNDRFRSNSGQWIMYFAIALAIPFGINLIGHFQPPKFELLGALVPILLPLVMYLTVSFYEKEYLQFYYMAIGVEALGLIIPMVQRFIYPRVRNVWLFYALQAGFSTPWMLALTFPAMGNAVSANLDMTLSMALTVYLLGYFTGKGAIGLYYFINQWIWGGR